MIRQTSLAQTIDLAADKARYDACAKKILSFRAIIAWILKCCTKEFSQYTVPFIFKIANLEEDSRASCTAT